MLQLHHPGMHFLKIIEWFLSLRGVASGQEKLLLTGYF